jgi:natural product biosynthesis luciferase-like monooxygenase protein
MIGQEAGGFSCVVLGEQSLLIQCCEALIERGHRIEAVVAEQRQIVDWCAERAIPCFADFAALRELPRCDYLFSITNLRMLPEWLLSWPTKLAINFHDGPLPRYAGLNTPVWALLNGESEYGVSWHEMAAEADTGPLLATRRFPIAPSDTALSLNAQCYQAGLESFLELLDALGRGTLQPQPQDLSQRTYFGLAQRPAGAGLLDWRLPAAQLERLIRALDFGTYLNPLLLPRLDLGRDHLLARQAELVELPGSGEPGRIESCCERFLTVRCGQSGLRLLRLTDLNGEAVDVAARLTAAGLAPGRRLPLPPEWLPELDEKVAELARFEGFWRRRLRSAEPVELPFAARASGPAQRVWQTHTVASLPVGGAAALVTAFAALFARLSGRDSFTLACVPAAAAAAPAWFDRYFERVLPLPVTVDGAQDFASLCDRVGAALADSERRHGYLNDLRARDPELRAVMPCAEHPLRLVRVARLDEAQVRTLAGDAALTLAITDSADSYGLLADTSRFDASAQQRLVELFEALVAAINTAPERPLQQLDLLTAGDRRQLATFTAGPGVEVEPLCVHQQFERQVEIDPQRTAVICDGESLSYEQLNRRANQLARHLRALGVTTGEPVGVLVERSLSMLVALYAVHKAGAAYVPLDPVYPHDRLAYMAEDAGLRVVITQRAFADVVSVSAPVVLDEIDATLAALPDTNLDEVRVAPSDLAYLIYTSGSTGKPKGVMVEHGNVVNFFAGMDQRLEPGPGHWLAVTSISFDISVLELFWTLTRGLTVVLYADNRRQRALPRALQGARRIEFGLFYWNVANDESEYDAQKYRLLLEGARFADTHGFNSVWTPERHFAAFGGLFPNPSVTSAALATITQNVALRAGSCVLPLHSPIRVAEEWAVVDNLSNGRVGLSIAAGWAPPDFAIRPEGFANAKQVMFESAELVKRLWRGETIEFPGPPGGSQAMVPVRTLPRPIQKELPIWVTTAGNVDTFIQAARNGANVLTHLLGQTVEEVGEKVRAYRQAWREAGHPGRGVVTLMLHTFVGPDADAVERAVRKPLKDYLKSAMFLVKSAAWNFPTFKKMSEEQGKTLDEFFATISDDDMDGLLEHAFQRYFHSSGLFGTPESCLATVERVLGADVDEIACLIDFGINTDVVLEHLPWLDQLRDSVQRAAAQSATVDADDFSLPALFARYPITHFQCTPSMATMLAADPTARPGLAALRQMMVGGEAFPPELARALRGLVGGRVTNMYGPTETTIWSSCGDVDVGLANNVSIGTPLANQNLYILDRHQQPLPVGLAGELVIGGRGVVRGYWQRPELTAEKFLPDPFAGDGGRMYRTGDLARFLPDGRVECLGRTDHQVKIRGYRVELGEIEALLREADGVLEAAVVLREDTPGDQRLVAYYRVRAGAAPRVDALREGLRRQLPDFMVPTAFVELSSLPLTPNGKLDRKALPAPQAQAVASAAYQPPQGGLETQIAAIWQRLLGIDKVGVRDNFFDIGGHSLLVVQVLKELRELVDRPLQMTDLFRYTTVEALARFLGGDDDDGPSAVGRGQSRAEARRAALNRRRR